MKYELEMPVQIDKKLDDYWMLMNPYNGFFMIDEPNNGFFMIDEPNNVKLNGILVMQIWSTQWKQIHTH